MNQSSEGWGSGPPSCPACGSGDVVPIVYGFPSGELLRESEEGKVVLGGCCVTGEDPQWCCRKCGDAWGTEEP